MNWSERVKRANKAKRFTEEDLALATLWTTHPISEFADQIELKEGQLEKGPQDIYLVLDGIYFTKGIEDNVNGNNLESAKIGLGLATHCHEAIVQQVEALKNGTDRITTLKNFLGGELK